jgi:hypothetical protein
MRLAPSSFACASLAAIALSATSASAGAPDVALRWVAPSACPAEAEVRAAVERLVGQPLGGGQGAKIQVRIVAAPAREAPWAATISVTRPGEGEARERRIEASTCAELADAAAVAVALSLEPPAAPPPPPRPGKPPAAPIRLRPGLRIAMGLEIAALPRPAPGLSVAGLLLFGKSRVEIAGAAWLPQRTDAQGGAGARLTLIAATARYCRAFVERALSFSGCATFEAGAIGGSGFGLARSASGFAPWVAPGLGVMGGYALSRRLAITLALDGVVPVTRAAFSLEGVGVVHRTPPLSGRALLGLEARWP